MSNFAFQKVGTVTPNKWVVLRQALSTEGFQFHSIESSEAAAVNVAQSLLSDNHSAIVCPGTGPQFTQSS